MFITFEGGEGSGKTTQLERLAVRLRSAGIDPLVTREPGGTPLAESIRELLLDATGHHPGPLAEAFLMEAARSDLVTRVIRPALDGGRTVLCDRYDDSTLAYQGAGRGIALDLLSRMNRAATGGLKPDVTLLYDLDPEIGVARRRSARAATNRLDRESIDFYRRVRAQYLELAAAEPGRFVVLDASRDPDALTGEAWAVLSMRLGKASRS